jgi:hypothetical protein
MNEPKRDVWYDGRYFGIPVKIRLIGEDGMDMRADNRFLEFLVLMATVYENTLNVVCSILFDNYEPHFRAKIKVPNDDELES